MSAAPNQRLTNIAWILFFSAVAFFPIFLNLENQAIRMYDESRLTINAYEMSTKGNYLVMSFEGQPDMWNTKPPLMIWLQVACIKVFGFNELAVRLPSALATLFLCIVMFVFCFRFLKNPWLGIFAVAILVSCEGFIREHISRTGDFDALLTFFTTLYLLSFFVFTETENQKQKNKFLLLFFISLTLGVMTKGIAAFIFLPAVFIYMLISKQFIVVLKNRNFYFGILLFVIIVGGYYWWREMLTPGYFNKVAENELGGRYLETIEGHKHGGWFYFDNMVDQGMKHWYLYVLPGLAIGLFMKEKKMRNFAGYILLCGFFYFFVITSGQTKLNWYDAPLYPLIAFAVAIFFRKIFELLKNSVLVFSDLKINISPYVMVFLFFVTPYNEIISKVYFPKEDSWMSERYAISYYLRNLVQGKKKSDGRIIVHDGYHAHLLFYIHQLEEKGIFMKLTGKRDLQPGDIAIAYQQKVKDYIANNYEEEILEVNKEVVTYKINGK